MISFGSIWSFGVTWRSARLPDGGGLLGVAGRNSRTRPGDAPRQGSLIVATRDRAEDRTARGALTLSSRRRADPGRCATPDLPPAPSGRRDQNPVASTVSPWASVVSENPSSNFTRHRGECSGCPVKLKWRAEAHRRFGGVAVAYLNRSSVTCGRLLRRRQCGHARCAWLCPAWRSSCR